MSGKGSNGRRGKGDEFNNRNRYLLASAVERTFSATGERES
jgi:hypothetical protein